MKPGRQKAILTILEEQEIGTQQQLLLALAQRGFHCTQATLSRDMKDLRLGKRPGRFGLCYALPARDDTDAAQEQLQVRFRESVKAIEAAQNLLVLKTVLGTAAEVCAAVDALAPENLVGSIAGQDTVFLAMRDNESTQKLCRAFRMLLK